GYAVKATCLAAEGNGLAAKPTTSGVKGIALMAVFFPLVPIIKQPKTIWIWRVRFLATDTRMFLR
ncbi:hypothetical protein ED312_07670, partial [Sinomicrobium pectinilyticum]